MPASNLSPCKFYDFYYFFLPKPQRFLCCKKDYLVQTHLWFARLEVKSNNQEERNWKGLFSCSCLWKKMPKTCHHHCMKTAIWQNKCLPLWNKKNLQLARRQQRQAVQTMEEAMTKELCTFFSLAHVFQRKGIQWRGLSLLMPFLLCSWSIKLIELSQTTGAM